MTKQRTKAKNDHELVHSFFYDKQFSESYTGRIFSSGNKIYSYGYHFIICEIKEGFYLFTDRTYSNTTAKHKSLVLSAIPDRNKIIRVPSLDVDNETNLRYYILNLNESVRKHLNARKNSYYSEICSIQSHFIKFVNLYNIKLTKEQKYIYDFQISNDNLAELYTYLTGEYIKQRTKRIKAGETKKLKAIKVQQLEQIEKFYNFEISSIYNSEFSHLRVKDGIIQTSQRVEIPLAIAQRYTGGNLLSYQFRASGNIIEFGCHRFTKDYLNQFCTNNNINFKF